MSSVNRANLATPSVAYAEVKPLGRLYLVPTPLDFGCDSAYWSPITDVLPHQVLTVAGRLAYWIAENAKTTRAFLQRVSSEQPLHLALQQIDIQELPRHIHKKGDHHPPPPSSLPTQAKTPAFDARELLTPALQGHDMGLVSEAGMPAIADPGSSVVRAAHTLGIVVQPLVGPVSLMLALAASGLNGQQFAFVGYLPQDHTLRSQHLRALEHTARQTGQTQLFIETPYRNSSLLQTALHTLKPETHLAVMCGMTLTQQSTAARQSFSATVKVWKSKAPTLDLKKPAVFLIGV